MAEVSCWYCIHNSVCIERDRGLICRDFYFCPREERHGRRQETNYKRTDASAPARQCWDLTDLEYSGHLANGDELVTAFFLSGGRKCINVSGDSGIALIIDIAKGLL